MFHISTEAKACRPRPGGAGEENGRGPALHPLRAGNVLMAARTCNDTNNNNNNNNNSNDNAIIQQQITKLKYKIEQGGVWDQLISRLVDNCPFQLQQTSFQSTLRGKRLRRCAQAYLPGILAMLSTVCCIRAYMFLQSSLVVSVTLGACAFCYRLLVRPISLLRLSLLRLLDSNCQGSSLWT